ncbi:hypothetical protein F2Q69_00007453 [Brassica cretica]|uniref:RBR-type E3 ubiquitin transferase n=1 Tax=Brassica cretica TaxID=69181 RepID=A0A8S9P7K7_BRACR|nr:hypothetical protein F2Q69_00007453 [Brassica cretica]
MVCPAPGYDYALQRHEYLLEKSIEFRMLCLCGHTFCWTCKLESHRPVNCNDASAWFSPILYTLNKNTKPCPRCNSHVPRTADDPVLRMITCICSCSFCWRCLRSEEEHNGNWNCVEVSFQPSMKWKILVTCVCGRHVFKSIVGDGLHPSTRPIE